MGRTLLRIDRLWINEDPLEENSLLIEVIVEKINVESKPMERQMYIPTIGDEVP
jgi:hypothetical protein